MQAKARGSAAVQMEVNRGRRGVSRPIHLLNPEDGNMEKFARANQATYVSDPERFGWVEPGAFDGQVLALCGAGPSLATDPIYSHDQMWGCNSAVTWLHENGHNPTAAIGIDQTEGMLDDWADPPDVPYYVATTVNPKLIAHLLAHDRRIVFFHNLVGWPGEIEFYNSEPWPASYMVGTGANVLSRTIGLAAWMGFRRIDIYGADCAFGPNGEAHANGESWQEAYTSQTQVMDGEIGGKRFQTRPDMLMAAVDLARASTTHPGKVRLMGDTLPVSLLGMEDAFLDRVMCRLVDGKPAAFETTEAFHDHLMELNNG
jgi:hypothetical protein